MDANQKRQAPTKHTRSYDHSVGMAPVSPQQQTPIQATMRPHYMGSNVPVEGELDRKTRERRSAMRGMLIGLGCGGILCAGVLFFALAGDDTPANNDQASVTPPPANNAKPEANRAASQPPAQSAAATAKPDAAGEEAKAPEAEPVSRFQKVLSESRAQYIELAAKLRKQALDMESELQNLIGDRQIALADLSSDLEEVKRYLALEQAAYADAQQRLDSARTDFVNGLNSESPLDVRLVRTSNAVNNGWNLLTSCRELYASSLAKRREAGDALRKATRELHMASLVVSRGGASKAQQEKVLHAQVEVDKCANTAHQAQSALHEAYANEEHQLQKLRSRVQTLQDLTDPALAPDPELQKLINACAKVTQTFAVADVAFAAARQAESEHHAQVVLLATLANSIETQKLDTDNAKSEATKARRAYNDAHARGRVDKGLLDRLWEKVLETKVVYESEKEELEELEKQEREQERTLDKTLAKALNVANDLRDTTQAEFATALQALKIEEDNVRKLRSMQASEQDKAEASIDELKAEVALGLKHVREANSKEGTISGNMKVTESLLAYAQTFVEETKVSDLPWLDELDKILMLDEETLRADSTNKRTDLSNIVRLSNELPVTLPTRLKATLNLTTRWKNLIQTRIEMQKLINRVSDLLR